jgi:PKD repeat protein
MKTKTVFCLALAMGLMLILGSIPASADLSGSKVEFAPSAGGIGATCYIPNRPSQTLCFSGVTVTDDGEDADILFLKFPSDWTVYGAGEGGHPMIVSASCTNGGTIGTDPSGVSWASMGAGLYQLEHDRTPATSDTCTAVYCFTVNTGATTTSDASVDWSWFSSDTITDPPHRPCSGSGWDDPLPGTCDATEIPAATVPVCEHVTLTVLPETLPAGEAGTPYSQQLSPYGADYWWSTSGSMPVDFFLWSNTGQIDWWSPVAGTYNFTAHVHGPGWSDGSRDYTLVINPKLTFSPASLPAGTVNVAYDQTVAVGGGTAPYDISLGAGSDALPAGLSYSTDGEAGTFTLSGTPTVVGTFHLELQAQDTNGAPGQKGYDLVIARQEATFTFTSSPNPSEVGQEVTFSLSATGDGVNLPYGTANFYINDTWTCGDVPLNTQEGVQGDYPAACAVSDLTAGTYAVRAEYTDQSGFYNDASVTLPGGQTVTGEALPPQVGPPSVGIMGVGLAEPSEVGQEIQALAPVFYAQEGVACTVDYGDGSDVLSGTMEYAEYGTLCLGPLHTYTVVGTYTVTIVATNPDGQTGSNSASHEVVAELPHYFTWNPELPLEGGSATFTAALPEGATVAEWARSSEPGGATCDESLFPLGEDPTIHEISFHASGDYLVCLTWYDSASDSYRQDNQTVTVANVAPTVTGAGIVPEPSAVGEPLQEAYAAFFDYDPLASCSVDYGEGADPEAGTIYPEENACAGPAHTYTTAGTYQVVFAVTDSDGAPATATVTHTVTGVATPPAITTHPQDQTVSVGGEVSFSAAASGNPVPTLQWQVSTDGGSTWTDIPDANTSPLTFNASLDQNGYQYRAVFTNDAGSATSDPATLTVSNLAATCTIEGWSGPYDSSAHGASGTCTGADGAALDGLDLGDTFTDVPGGTAHWSFTDATGTYGAQSGDVEIVISPVDATCSVTGWSGTYDGSAHGASGSCIGVGGAEVSGLDLGDTFTDVPGGTAHWTFSNANYNAQSGDVDIVIGKADATCDITGWSGPYDGSAHGASGTCTGVGGAEVSGLDLGAPFTDVPGGTAHWTFSNANYNAQSGDVDIVIGKADATCDITGWSGPYDGSAHGASGTCTGVDGAELSGLDLGATFTDVPGGTAHWTFTDVTGNYSDQSGDVDIVINAEANTAPVANPGGPYLAAINDDMSFDGSGSSDPEGDDLAYAWTFDDGATDTGAMPTHSYAAVGIYNVCLTVNDGIADSEAACTIAVVYDPSAGFVTGGGSIDSPVGAYKPDESLSGKATFGFLSKYKKGASTPEGRTEFEFRAGYLDFHGTAMDWLVVSKDQATAQFKGSGTVNGGLDQNGNAYKFMLWAGDGEPDTFRIRIWWEDDAGAEYDVYDNGFDQPIVCGNIVVHTK